MSLKSSGKSTLKKVLASWDKLLLLCFISALFILFLVLNRVANTFLPDARLYPYVMTNIALLLSLLSIFRVITGREPNLDAQSGKDQNQSAEQTRHAYKKIVAYMLLFCAFYFAVWLVGFRVPAVLFVFGFIRYFGHSYLQSAFYAFCGFSMIEILSRLLHLELPPGIWHFFSGS